jgi:ribonuclease HI
MAKNKYYAYLVDGKKGITDNWPECQQIVAGKKAKYKGFESKEAALLWLEAGADYSVKHIAVEEGIYFDAGTGAGNGVEINVTDRHGKSFIKQTLGHDVTNNYGELLACKNALEIAIKKDAKRVFGDSRLVIDYWSKWMIKKEVEENTRELAKEVSLLRKKFEAAGGELVRISGGSNPADLGFHRG